MASSYPDHMTPFGRRPEASPRPQQCRALARHAGRPRRPWYLSSPSRAQPQGTAGGAGTRGRSADGPDNSTRQDGSRPGHRHGVPGRPATPRPRFSILRRVGPTVAEPMHANATLRAFSALPCSSSVSCSGRYHFHGVNGVTLSRLLAPRPSAVSPARRFRSALRSRRPYVNHLRRARCLHPGDDPLRDVLRAVGGACGGPGRRVRPGPGQAGP